MVAELLGAIGGAPVGGARSGEGEARPSLSPLTGQLLTACLQGFLVLRRAHVEFTAMLGAWAPLGLPGLATPADAAALRARLLLHVAGEEEAAALFAARLAAFLHLDAQGQRRGAAQEGMQAASDSATKALALAATLL